MNLSARYITLTAGTAGIFLGVSVIAGWIFSIEELTRIFIGNVPVRFNLAVCFLLAGISLLLLQSGSLTVQKKRWALILNGIVFLLGVLTLLQYIFHWNLPIDHITSIKNPVISDLLFTGRMTPYGAAFVVLNSLAIFFLHRQKYLRLIQELLFFSVLISIIILINAVTGTFVIKQVNAPPLPAVLMQILFATGIFFSQPLQQQKISFERKLSAFFILIIFVLGFIFFALNKNQKQLLEATRQVEHTKNVLLLSQSLFSKNQELYIATRDYVLTGREAYLELFRNAIKSTEHAVRQLRGITSDNPRQQTRIDSLEKLIAASFRYRNQLIEVRKKEGLNAAIKIIESKEREKITTAIEQQLAALTQEEERLLAQRKSLNQQSEKNSSKVISLLQILAVFLVLAAWLVIHYNIRKRNQAEAILLEYQYFFNNNSDLCGIANKQGYFEHINTSLATSLGFSEKEFCSIPFIELVHPDDRKATLQEYKKLNEGATVLNFTNRYRKKDGEYLVLEWDAAPDPFTNKLFCIARDITQRTLMEEKLREFNRELEKQVAEKTREVIEKEKQYRFLLQNMQEGIQVIGYDWKYLFVNNSVIRQSKYSGEELLGYTLMEKYPGIENTGLFSVLQRCMTERQSHVMENEFTFPDGTKEWYELHIQPVPEGLFILSLDITERKKAEDEASRLFKTLHHSLNEIYIFDSETLQFLYVNNGALKNLGYTTEEIKKLTPLDINPDYTRSDFIDLVTPLLHGQEDKIVFYTRHQRKDGSFYPVEVHLQMIQQDTQKVFLAVILDITERKKAEEKINAYLQELKLSNERFELVNRATQDTLWEWDYASRKGRWGQGIIKTYGYPESELINEDNWVEKYVHPFDREQLNRILQTAMESHQETWHDEFRFRCADGTYKYVYNRGYIQYDEKGKPRHMYGAMTDVTEMKRLERIVAEQQVRQQKLLTEAAIDAQEKERNELGRELHDNINQILATVKMYLGIALSRELIPTDLIDQSYEYVSNAIEEIRKLSHSLVEPSLQDMGLKEALAELTESVSQTGLKICLQFDLQNQIKEPDKRKELMLYRIVQEQLNNIVKYAQASEVGITVKTENDLLFLSIADNGRGFDPEKKAKGIGLKNINSRVSYYDGKMNIRSAPGQGCALEVWIPFS